MRITLTPVSPLTVTLTSGSLGTVRVTQAPASIALALGGTGPQGPVGEAFIQLDGGTASSSYGGISPIDGGGA